MIFLFSSTGATISITPEKVYQGSNKANEIHFLCPTSTQNQVSVAFTLANGVSVPQAPMSLNAELNGVADVNGNALNAWRYQVPSAVTQYAGVVTVQFFVTETGGAVVSTQSAQFTVEKGVPVVEPEPETYQSLLSSFMAFTAQTDGAVGQIEGELNEFKTQTQGEVASLSGAIVDGDDAVKADTAQKLDALKTELKADATQKVGELEADTTQKLSALETDLKADTVQKVGALEADINAELGKKVTASSLAAPTCEVYGKDLGGNQMRFKLTEEVESNSAVMRNGHGYAYIETPTAAGTNYDKAIANRAYVDNKKVYWYNMTLKGSNCDILFIGIAKNNVRPTDIMEAIDNVDIPSPMLATGWVMNGTERVFVSSVDLLTYLFDGVVTVTGYNASGTVEVALDCTDVTFNVETYGA